MKVQVKNLGVLRQAEFELGEFTIICGGNNTGKPMQPMRFMLFSPFGEIFFS